MTTFATDTFTDSAGTSITSHTMGLGGPWIAAPGSGYSGTAVITDANRVRGATGIAMFVSTAVAATKDQIAEADFYYAGATGGATITLLVLRQTTTSSVWGGYNGTGANEWQVWTGTPSKLGYASATLTPGQTYHVQFSAIGNRLRLVVDGVTVIDVATTVEGSPGNSGVLFYNPTTNSTGAHIDNLVLSYPDYPGRVFFHGNSWVEGYNATSLNGFAQRTRDIIMAEGFDAFVFGHAGDTTATVLSEVTSRVTPWVNAEYPLLVMGFEQINSSYVGTESAEYDRIVDYGQAVQALGAEAMWMNCPSIRGGVHDIARVTVNNLTLADFDATATTRVYEKKAGRDACDYVLDLGSEPNIGPIDSYLNGTYYGGTGPTFHLIDAGHTLLVTESLRAIRHVFPVVPVVSGGATSGSVGVPTPAFTFTMPANLHFGGSSYSTVTLTASEGTITATAAGGSISGNGSGAVQVTPVAGATSFTFTYTPGTSGSKTITFTNGQSWTNPSAINFTTGGSNYTSPLQGPFFLPAFSPLNPIISIAGG